jgi:hypothetical protein
MVQQYFITGWGQLIPARAAAPAAAAGPGAAPRSGSSRPASSGRSNAEGAKPDGAAVDALATEEPRAPRSPSTGGRKRRTKRR